MISSSQTNDQQMLTTFAATGTAIVKFTCGMTLLFGVDSSLMTAKCEEHDDDLRVWSSQPTATEESRQDVIKNYKSLFVHGSVVDIMAIQIHFRYISRITLFFPHQTNI